MAMQEFFAKNRNDIHDVIRANRQDYLNRFINLDSWGKLSEKIKKFAPDVVILQSRRMPRLYKLLADQNILNFKAKFISEFALPFMGEGLKNKRLAIVDDTVNGGRTLKETFLRLEHTSAEVEAFALLKREGASVLDKNKITYIFDKVSEKDYRESSARTALALWLANKPFECEFPVYKLKERSQDLSWPHFLTRKFGKQAVHRLDIPDAPFIGYARYSVDLAPDEPVNHKLRIYEDLITGQTSVTCMLDMRGGIIDRYHYSRKMGNKIIANELKEAGVWEIADEDLNLLFGSRNIPSLPNKTENHAAQDFMASHWLEIRKNIQPGWSLYDCFYNFFIALRDNLTPMQEKSIRRLHIGPTFAQLYQIMQEMWQPEGSNDNLHFLLSQLLDEQIDRGFIVPELDNFGNRIFRKGEPAGNDTGISQILESMGVPVKPEENLHGILKKLTKEQSQRLEHLRRLSEEH